MKSIRYITLFLIIFSSIQNQQKCLSSPCSSHLLKLADDAVYAPWRDTYKEAVKEKKSYDQSCVFCALFEEEGHNFILARYEYCFVLLNIYPYTKGHLLVIPYQHAANLADLCPEARFEIINVVSFCLNELKSFLKCEGFNVGMNVGQAAKASVPEHLHVHVMPRYKVDAGFAHLIGGTKVVAWDLQELYYNLLPIFEK